MSVLNEISEMMQRGKVAAVKELIAKALEEGVSAASILQDALLPGMDVVGEKFKNNQIYVPEVLIAQER